MTTFADRLRYATENAGLNGKELAEASGLSQPYVSQLLSGAREMPSRETVDRLAQAVGVGRAYLEGLLSAAQEIEINEHTFRWLSRPVGGIHGGSRSSGRKHGDKPPNKQPDPTTLFGGKRFD